MNTALLSGHLEADGTFHFHSDRTGWCILVYSKNKLL